MNSTSERSLPGRRARISLDGQPVGWLVETGSGSAFTYDDEWLQHADAWPISLTMPLRVEPYTSPSLHPYFANLLPEGWLLDLSTARLKIARDDVFGLLLALCRDCVGAVEVLPEASTTAAVSNGAGAGSS